MSYLYITNQILRGAGTIRRNSREEWKERAEKAEAERDAYKKLALELCAELCQICKDPIHLKQLEELSK